MRQLPVHGRARGLDGQADARAGTCRSSTRTSSRCRRASSGEICLRARSNPHYPLGYWNNEEAAQETFGGDWFHTKDAASFDEDGYVWYEGRADDVIIAAGYRIGPFEVESACLEHAAVKEAAAVASPDERRGSVVKAFIVLAEGHSGSDELVAEIQAHVRSRLSAYAYPRKIEFVDDLPKTLTGKIRRIELRQREAGGKAGPWPRRPGRRRTQRARPVTRALLPQWVARLFGLAALGVDRRARVAAAGARAVSSGTALLWVRGRGRGGGRRCCLAARAAPAVAAAAFALRAVALVCAVCAGYVGSPVAGLELLQARAIGTSCSPGSAAACRRSAPCGCRTPAPTRGRGSCSSCSAPSC